MPQTFSLTDHFLIAMPQLQDPNFFHGVTYICEHNENGAMGILINRPLDLSEAEVFDQLGLQIPNPPHRELQPVYVGGPVQSERGFIIHHPVGHWDTSLRVTRDIAVTSSRDILEALAQGQGPQRYLIALGYAGWGPGQLESELAQNAWINVPADDTVIFNTPPTQRWEVAAALGGIDLARLSGDVGHA
ncbi:MAG: YqgE/AlgH family protein [Gammaproteobacteria bacterium]|nr:YqgE/AlgH family protein [Gammaproteobacteria bacterium]